MLNILNALEARHRIKEILLFYLAAFALGNDGSKTNPNHISKATLSSVFLGSILAVTRVTMSVCLFFGTQIVV